MRRLVAVTAIAAALGSAPAFAYSRSCGGVLDTECHGTTCHTDCFQGDCLVWVDALHNTQTAVCLGSPVH